MVLVVAVAYQRPVAAVTAASVVAVLAEMVPIHRISVAAAAEGSVVAAVAPLVEPQETAASGAVAVAGLVLSQLAAPEVSVVAEVAVVALEQQLSRQVATAQFCCSGRRAIR